MSDTKKNPSLPTRWRLLVRSDTYLSSQAKLVAYVLSTYMDNKTGICYPSHLSIAQGCGWKIPPGTTSHRGVSRATSTEGTRLSEHHVTSRDAQHECLQGHLPDFRPGSEE